MILDGASHKDLVEINKRKNLAGQTRCWVYILFRSMKTPACVNSSSHICAPSNEALHIPWPVCASSEPSTPHSQCCFPSPSSVVSGCRVSLRSPGYSSREIRLWRLQGTNFPWVGPCLACIRPTREPRIMPVLICPGWADIRPSIIRPGHALSLRGHDENPGLCGCLASSPCRADIVHK